MSVLLGSAADGTETLQDTFELPSVSASGGDVLLIAFLQNRPPNDLSSTGWTLRENQVVTPSGPDGALQYAMFDRFHASTASPYHDTFDASADCRWSAAQLAFRSTGTSVPRSGGDHATYSDPGATNPELSASLGGTADEGNVLVAYASMTTKGGTGQEIVWPDGWIELEVIPSQASFIGLASVAYRVADGSETEVEVEISGAQISSMTVLIGEYEIDATEGPPSQAEAWDIYDAAALNGAIIATLVNAKGRMIRSELHGLGEGGFTINRHAAEATEDILAEGNIVKVRIADCGPDYIDGFFLGPDGDYTLLSSHGGRGREDLTFRGPGALSYLDRARMTPCAFSIPPDEVGVWDRIWRTNNVAKPGGVAFDPDDPDYVWVGGVASRKVKKLDQATREVVDSSPALWAGGAKYLGGISFDPDDDGIMWALEIPWLSGSNANTKIRKINRSNWNTIDVWDLGDPVKLTDIRVDGDFVWTTRYDNDRIQQRSKSNAANVVDSFEVEYKGKTQRKPNGLAILGTKVAYWFGGDSGGGTGRALIADTSDPDDIIEVQKTTGISGFGGEWTEEGGEEFLYVVSYTLGRTAKYQLTEARPACADESGVFHPEQVSPGALAWRVLVEITHEDRPVQECPELTFDFTEDEDSNGTPWPARTSTEEFTWRVGDRAYSDVLAQFIPAGVTFDLDVNTMTLHAYVDEDFGTDRTGEDFAADVVQFVEGVNLGVNGEFRRRDNRGQPDTYITVAGDGKVYGDATLAGRYVRHGFMAVSGPTTGGILDAIGEDELARQRLVADALGYETLWADDETNGKYIPFKHYWKGDRVTIDMEPGEFSYVEQDLRVYGTLISERDGGWRSAIDLGAAYKIPEAISSLPDDEDDDNGKKGGGKKRGGRGGKGGKDVPLTVTDDEDITIRRVKKIIAAGIRSPEPGVVELPTAAAISPPDVPVIEELLTDILDTGKVYAPDGVGGVTVVDAPTGGGGGGGELASQPVAIVQRTSDWPTNSTDNIPVAFDELVKDTHGFFDPSEDTRLRVTAEFDGLDVVLHGEAIWPSGADYKEIKFIRNGDVDDPVAVFQVPGAATGNTGIALVSRPIPVSTDDYFEMVLKSGSSDAALAHPGIDGDYSLIFSMTVQTGGAGGAAAIAALGFVGPLLMEDGVTSPPVPLETEDGSDWLYADT